MPAPRGTGSPKGVGEPVRDEECEPSPSEELAKRAPNTTRTQQAVLRLIRTLPPEEGARVSQRRLPPPDIPPRLHERAHSLSRLTLQIPLNWFIFCIITPLNIGQRTYRHGTNWPTLSRLPKSDITNTPLFP